MDREIAATGRLRPAARRSAMNGAAHLWDEAAKCRRILAHTSDTSSREALVTAITDLEGRAMRLVEEARQPPPTPVRCTFHRSPEGERWSVDAGGTEEPWIVHQCRDAHHASTTQLGLSAFLTLHGRETPQHQALLRFLSKLVEKCADQA